jgi:hypothetical protein
LPVPPESFEADHPIGQNRADRSAASGETLRAGRSQVGKESAAFALFSMDRATISRNR